MANPNKTPQDEHPSDRNERPAAARPYTEPKDKVLGTATWLGEGPDGPNVNEWNGVKFKVGEAVDITNPQMMAKALTNRFYDAVEFAPVPKAPAPPAPPAPAPAQRSAPLARADERPPLPNPPARPERLTE